MLLRDSILRVQDHQLVYDPTLRTMITIRTAASRHGVDVCFQRAKRRVELHGTSAAVEAVSRALVRLCIVTRKPRNNPGFP